MQKITIATCVFAASLLFAGAALSQQSTAPATPPAKAPQTPAAGATKTTTPKTVQTPAAKTPAPLVLKTQKDKASYAIGINLGKNIKKDSVEIDPAILLRGLKDGMAGSKSLLTDEEAKAALVALQAEVRKREESLTQQASAANKKAGEEFLAANKTKEGVVTLPSGLQYKIITTGTGPKPVATDSVVCNYRGTLVDNTEFDSSYKRGQPATFPVNQVIKGWTEALQLMPVGSKWELFVPSELAYGDRGASGSPIGPSSTLIFEVELLSIQAKADAAPKPDASPKPDATPKPDGATKPAASPN
jgi:FKBP-type peptidyl-prolyl cis-trans isomerase FklB